MGLLVAIASPVTKQRCILSSIKSAKTLLRMNRCIAGFSNAQKLRPAAKRCPSLWHGAIRPFLVSQHDKLSAAKTIRQFSTPAVVPELDLRTDFFGEPITFLVPGENTDIGIAVNAMDEFIVAVTSKGNSCSGGGDEEGLSTKAAHSTALVWAELLRHAAVYHSSAPMLAAAAVGPVLAQANVSYLCTLDSLLKQVDAQVPVMVNMLGMARTAAAMKDDEQLTPRERQHLKALHHMLRHERRQALETLLELLMQAPGDGLALSLAIDLANAIGDRGAAFRAAGFVASYWQERGERGLRPSMPGYPLALSWIALGFAVGGRLVEAERLAERAMYKDANGCGAVATLALAHVYDAEGRTAEAISKLASDGLRHFEGSGLLFFDYHLAAYGARFVADREGLGGGRSSLRIYDTCFDRVLQYSGYARGEPWGKPQRRAPKALSTRIMESAGKGATSFLGRLFGSQDTPPESETKESEGNPQNEPKLALEDVLVWMPPTPQLLTDATLLLLRLTINGSVSPDNQRWRDLSNAWNVLLALHQRDSSDEGREPDSSSLPPMAAIAAPLACTLESLPAINDGALELCRPLSLFGELLRSEHRSNEEAKVAWISVVNDLSASLIRSDDFKGWDLELRPLLDQIICYAACRSKDYESLCVARSVCSQGVSLRANCPEEWRRYSVVLEHLGDDVAAEDARAASISLGLGEGGFGE